jgi:hypothetical protein
MNTKTTNKMNKQLDPVMSLYIPRVFKNITKEHMVRVFNTLRIGSVKRIDFISKTNKNNVYNEAYIHFNYWHNNIANINLQEKIRNPKKEARIVYDDPWFWLILENIGVNEPYLDYCDFELNKQLMEDDVYVDSSSASIIETQINNQLELNTYTSHFTGGV